MENKGHCYFDLKLLYKFTNARNVKVKLLYSKEYTTHIPLRIELNHFEKWSNSKIVSGSRSLHEENLAITF